MRDRHWHAHLYCCCCIHPISPQGEAIVKYTHNEAIQALAFSPTSGQLVSCSTSDIGLWSPDSASVNKIRIGSKALCAAWAMDGEVLAVGHQDGTVTLRNASDGKTTAQFRRSGPVWCLQWSPSPEEAFAILAVGAWDFPGEGGGTLSFYQQSGKQQGESVKLGFDPTSLSFFSAGEYLVVAGSDKKAWLFTRDGIRLHHICEKKDWVWTAKPKPGTAKGHFVAVGTADGNLAMHQLMFSTVHGLYQDRYAYRDGMTDVIVQHMVTEQRVRLKLRAYVKKISVYTNRLAVQLPDSVRIYELAEGGDQFSMHYRPMRRIQRPIECNLLVVTSQHVTLCMEKRLQLLSLDGDTEREWVFDAVIRYIKVVGGPPGGEALLVGLRNGAVMQVFVGNPFPLELVRQKTSIRCLDLSQSRKRLAVVDDQTRVCVYDVGTKELLWQATGANSVAFNSSHEDSLCFSGDNHLSIKVGDFPVDKRPMPGFVVGFNRSMVYVLHFVAMRTVDVPQSTAMARYLELGKLDRAYDAACLGVTDQDWRTLGAAALQQGDLQVAKGAYSRVKDARFLSLVFESETKEAAGGVSPQEIAGEALAYAGRFSEAARSFVRASKPERAVDMFVDLRLWAEAKRLAQSTGSVDVEGLMLQQAGTLEAQGDYAGAASVLVAVGHRIRAIHLFKEAG